MGQTTNYNLPYPESTDPANVPADMRLLAEAVENEIEIIREEISESISNTIKYEDKTISIQMAANAFRQGSTYFTIPSGYKMLTANVISNGYDSHVITSIIYINTSNGQVVVNGYSDQSNNKSIIVRGIFVKE